MHKKKSSRKILMFFGSNIKGKDAFFLQHLCESGYALLPLDASAICLAAGAKLPYTLIDDWIDPAVMFQAYERACECKKKWFQIARDNFSSDGICWPKFDHHAMHWFWNDTASAMAFARVFRACSIQEVRFLRGHSRRPAEYYSPSDVFTGLLEAELPGVAKPYEQPEALPAIRQKPLWYRGLRYVKRKIVNTVNTGEKRKAASRSLLNGKVVLAFIHHESYRFTLPIRRLRESFPGKFSAVILSDKQSDADRVVAEHSIPVVLGPPPARVNSGLGKKFMRGYSHARNASEGQPWGKAMKDLGFHFEYYCKRRWPILRENLYFWLGLWRRTRPEVVLVSALRDSESQLPAEAATRLNIPNFSIPHSAVTLENPYPLAADRILYGLMTQKTHYEQSGIHPDHLIACRGIVHQNEYNVTPIEARPSRAAWRVLALTNLIGTPGTLASIRPAAQLEALRALNNPPEDVREKLCLEIKAHPRYPEVGLFAIAGDRLAKNLLPPDSELGPLLKETDLVVAVNYTYSALVHALRAGKAVIFFWTDPLVGKAGEHRNGDLFLPAGTLARSTGELWNSVRNFFTDSGAAARMRSKAREFARKNLDDSSYPAIDEALSEVIRVKG